MNRECRLTDRIVAGAAPAAREYSLRDSQVRGLSLRIQPTGARSWVLRGHLPDPTRRTLLADASCVPVQQARALAHSMLSGQPLPSITSAAARGPRFDAFAKTYQARRHDHWKPSTRRSNESYIRTTLIPAFGSMRLGAIHTPDVYRWFHAYGSKSPGGANRALPVLKDLFNRAIEWGDLPEGHGNPCKGVRHTKRPPRGAVLNSDAIKRLWSTLEAEPPRNNAAVDIVRLLMLTGCRVGEITGLRWEDVQPGTLRLADAKAGPRTVALGKPAQEILAYRLQHRASRWVFPGRRTGDVPMSRIPLFWSKVSAKAQLPAGFRLHDLRHTFASVALMEGESIHSTGMLLGHLDIRSTTRYAHLRSDFLMTAAESVAGRIADWLASGQSDTAQRLVPPTLQPPGSTFV